MMNSRHVEIFMKYADTCNFFEMHQKKIKWYVEWIDTW